MIRILSAALHVVLRRDMSLNRRLYAWLLGVNTHKHITVTHIYDMRVPIHHGNCGKLGKSSEVVLIMDFLTLTWWEP